VVHSFFKVRLQSEGKFEDHKIQIQVYDNETGAENPSRYPVPGTSCVVLDYDIEVC
jgi:hypothetical protein